MDALPTVRAATDADLAGGERCGPFGYLSRRATAAAGNPRRSYDAACLRSSGARPRGSPTSAPQPVSSPSSRSWSTTMTMNL